jgi:hypothetical protein
MAKPSRWRETHYHKNGSVRAMGWRSDGELDGYWEWFPQRWHPHALGTL